MKKCMVVALALVAVGAVIVGVLRTGGGEPRATRPSRSDGVAVELPGGAERGRPGEEPGGGEAADGAEEPAEGAGEGDAGESDEPQTEEERREAEEERLVEAFDELTDAWLEPKETGVRMADVDRFVAAFRRVPKSRQDECVHRALNLVPDENVMLLAGILMDRLTDREIVETVYNDVLNRDEEVKKPILQEIFKDKGHPCWADTAWILDVTGELPKSGDSSAADPQE